jgi:hypothetical protein
MRCPNTVCRAVFEVKEESAPSPPPTAPGPPPVNLSKQISGSVGQVVPILSAEVADNLPPAAAAPIPVEAIVPVVSAELAAESPAPPAWTKAPPPLRRGSVAEQTPPAVRPNAAAAPPMTPSAPSSLPSGPDRRETPAELDDFLDDVPEENADVGASEAREMGPGTWEAPPVRRAATTVTAPSYPLAEPPRSAAAAGASRDGRQTRRRMRWFIAGLVLVLGGSVAGGVWFIQGTRAGSEADRFRRAKELYQERSFAEAAAEMRHLLRDFPDSSDRSEYRLLAEWSDVRDAVYTGQPGPEELAGALGRLLQFLKLYQDDTLVKPYEGDIWHTLHKLVKELTAEADQQKDRRLLDKARRALAATRSLHPPSATNPLETTQQAESAIAEVERHIAERERRLALVGRVKAFVSQTSAKAVQDARKLVEASGLKADSELHDLLQELVKAHASSVKFTPVMVSEAQKPATLDREPSYLVTPLLRRSATAPAGGSATVFALARGVLYALEPRTGDIRWARRVGVDTTLLPLRLPAGPVAPEIALVLSSDSKTLSAVTADTGTTIWEHQLHDACVGQPVLAGNCLLVPTYPGRVDEIEMSEGKLVGYYQLGQPLTVGGVLQPGTSLVYFPADQFTVYVLDVARHACAQVLYAQHPSGSLRAAPIILSEPGFALDKKGKTGFLILSQADGLEAIKLRSFRLPVTGADDKPLKTEIKVPGWSWFPPFHDGERLAVATDAGLLALYGVRQKGNSRDPFLFPLLDKEVRLDSGTSRSGRAQLVHADAENMWVLAHGRLQRLQLTFTRQAGPGILDRWPEPLALGSPLHAAQVHEEGTERTVLYLVTQAQKGQTCLVSAVDARRGSIFWQRQLGLSIQAQPVAVAAHVLAQGQNGLFLFDTSDAPERAFQAGGTLALAFPRDDAARRFVLPAAKKDEAYVLSLAGRSLEVQLFQADTPRQPQPVRFTLRAALAGTPAAGKNCLVLPLDDGLPWYIPLENGTPQSGPDWRASGAEVNAVGHVVYVGGDDFVISDGSRGLHLVHWPEPKLSEKKSSTQLSRRIVAPPLLVPAAAGQKARLCVADAGGTLTLFETDTLTAIRSWRVADKISSGPFLRGPNIGCVVGGTRLIWIDPNKQEPLWEYPSRTQIVGEPQLAGAMVVVANLAGQFVGLDPDRGRPFGPGYTLHANVPPASAPMAFGAERLFVPLMDGTVMLLARKLLQE